MSGREMVWIDVQRCIGCGRCVFGRAFIIAKSLDFPFWRVSISGFLFLLVTGRDRGGVYRRRRIFDIDYCLHIRVE